MDRKYLYENLLEWIRLFSFVSADVNILTLLDGEIVSEILYKIEPSYFTEEWKSKLSFDSESNWRLKASNMKKIIAAMSDFLMALNLPLDNFQFPDSTKMCEDRDFTEMSRLLQLLLLCAVNCHQKEMYIQKIMSMESSKQLVIMKAIQEFMNSESSMDISIDGDDKTMSNKSDEIDFLKHEKEVLKQKCHDMEFKLSLITDEKVALEAEVKRLARQTQGDTKLSSMKLTSDSTFENDNNSPESMRIRQLQDRLCNIQGELFRVEQMKEDLHQKNEELEKENSEMLEKMERLNEEISDNRLIKDDLDITREKLKTLSGIETTLEKYKKHIDDSSELVRNNRQLELENSNYLERIFKLEEELKKTVSLKGQIEIYKEEISEIQSICSQKEKDFSKADFELKRLTEKFNVLENDKTALQEELKKLREENEDLHLNSYTIGSESSSDPNSECHDTNSIGDSIDLLEIPIGMREKVIRLQKEVKELRKNTTSDLLQNKDVNSQSREQLIVSLEASQARLKQLVTENKNLHQECLILNAKLEDLSSHNKDKDIRDSEKDSDKDKMAVAVEQTELKYKGYLEKAKYVIYHLHQKLLKYESTQNDSGSQEIATPPTPTGEQDASYAIVDKDSFTKANYESLKEAFMDKERQLDELKKQYENSQSLREEEEKMVVAAWYNLAVRLNREAAQDRLRNDSSDHSTISMNSSEPNSFLAKQRMAHLLSSNRSSRDDSIDRH